jgi:hypothetical protein
MTEHNDNVVFNDTFTVTHDGGSFNTITVTVGKASVGGMVVCFDAATDSYRISDPIALPRTYRDASTAFVHAVSSFVGARGDRVEHAVWESVKRLEGECYEAYGC